MQRSAPNERSVGCSEQHAQPDQPLVPGGPRPPCRAGGVILGLHLTTSFWRSPPDLDATLKPGKATDGQADVRIRDVRPTSRQVVTSAAGQGRRSHTTSHRSRTKVASRPAERGPLAAQAARHPCVTAPTGVSGRARIIRGSVVRLTPIPNLVASREPAPDHRHDQDIAGPALEQSQVESPVCRQRPGRASPPDRPGCRSGSSSCPDWPESDAGGCGRRLGWQRWGHVHHATRRGRPDDEVEDLE